MNIKKSKSFAQISRALPKEIKSRVSDAINSKVENLYKLGFEEVKDHFYRAKFLSKTKSRKYLSYNHYAEYKPITNRFDYSAIFADKKEPNLIFTTKQKKPLNNKGHARKPDGRFPTRPSIYAKLKSGSKKYEDTYNFRNPRKRSIVLSLRKRKKSGKWVSEQVKSPKSVAQILSESHELERWWNKLGDEVARQAEVKNA